MDPRPLGFSLLDLLITLAIAAVLLGHALIYLPDWVSSHRANTSLSVLRTAVNLARHAAARNATTVTMCPRGDGRCGDRNTWHAGIMIFRDKNSDREVNGDDEVYAQLPGPEHGTISWRSFRNRSVLRFTANGLTDWQNGHFQYCPASNDPRWARRIVLNAAGRIYPSHDRDGDGIHEDRLGAPLACS